MSRATPGNRDVASDSVANELSSSSSEESDYTPEINDQTLYTKNLRMIVSKHTPSAPFGLGYNTPCPPKHPNPTSLSLGELCFVRRPLEGYTFPDVTMHLTITAQIRAGTGLGPQVVIVNDDMVAKIYDPLYYDFSDQSDTAWDADKAYTCEAAAYEYLQKQADVQDILPAYYGTWTLNVDTTLMRDGQEICYTRPVRMILLEHLKGQCMVDVKAWNLSTHARTVILKQCLDAQIRILHAGVAHGDVCPRNIMMVGSDFVTPKLQIKLIDFEISAVREHSNYKFREYIHSRKGFILSRAPRLSSPVKIFFGHMMEFSSLGWCPGGYDGAERWLWEQYRNDDRYIPVRFKPPNNSYRRPFCVNLFGEIDDPDYEGEDFVSGSESET
ncbi:hypothetical protein OPT61_g6040 [Boeremia exigua]|uniref:Uncharacterized protein n=1 Tax=Boeremia exigua TaxID=749465 RepID=A0ACC2I845_9PLEO|nr:hypothetical protein OPT61_g6040 [Boeremia exigua]